MMERPSQDEFSSYYFRYVNLVSEGDIIVTLEKQWDDLFQFLNHLSEVQGQVQYAPEKWTIKEVIGHMIDTERIMSYRLLCIARGESASLPGFDENQYAAGASFNHQTIGQLLEHFSIVRQSTVLLLKSLNDQSWMRKGTVNQSNMTVRALAYIIAGHERHHLQIIKDRYLNKH